MRFVDTNVLLYSVSTLPGEVQKAATAQALLKNRDLALSVQVLREFHVQATRSSGTDPLSHDEALLFIETWKRFPVADVTLTLFHEEMAVKTRPRFSYWDSAIIAAERMTGCTEVLSEDMSAGQDYGGVRVVNPFAG